jgi:Ni2+-binding GTPase involved in maturation of urease and hydrogenase
MKKNINEFNQRIEIWIKNGKTNKGVNEITKTKKNNIRRS